MAVFVAVCFPNNAAVVVAIDATQRKSQRVTIGVATVLPDLAPKCEPDALSGGQLTPAERVADAIAQ